MAELSLFLDPQEGMSFSTLSSMTLLAEELGLYGVYRSDHLASTAGRFERPATEAWTTIAGLAVLTSQLRLGTLVSPVGFRHPSLYAKEINTVDEMSNGRVDVSIGTGWYAPEHELLGLPFGSLGERYAQLEAYLDALFSVWGAQPYGHVRGGASPYGVSTLTIAPQSIQRPHPHVVVGGHGPRRTPDLAARYGDEHNVDWLDPEATKARFARSSEACAALGRDPSTLVRSILTGAVVAERERDVPHTFERAMVFLGIDNPEGWRKRSADGWYIGTIEGLVERLADFVAAGTEHVVLMLAPGDDRELLSAVAEHVVPALSEM